MGYSLKVIDHYENPRNVGSFDKSDPNIGTGLLCDKCNRALGMLGDNIEGIAKVLLYLTNELITDKEDKAIDAINKVKNKLL